VHLGIEGPGLRRGAQRRERFCVASLPRESHPEVKRRIPIVGTLVEHGAKRTLRVQELLELKVSPASSEVVSWRRQRAAVRRAGVAPFREAGNCGCHESHEAGRRGAHFVSEWCGVELFLREPSSRSIRTP
jgi:hypothetical protein